jgi:hypothetical protein
LTAIGTFLLEYLGFVVEDGVFEDLFNVFLCDFDRLFTGRAQVLASINGEVYFVVSELLGPVLRQQQHPTIAYSLFYLYSVAHRLSLLDLGVIKRYTAEFSPGLLVEIVCSCFIGRHRSNGFMLFERNVFLFQSCVGPVLLRTCSLEKLRRVFLIFRQVLHRCLCLAKLQWRLRI